MSTSHDMTGIRQGLELLESKMIHAVESLRPEIDLLHPSQRLSARNLIRYLSLRGEDVRALQDELHMAGLSSLASSESHILRQVQAILERLGKTYDKVSECDYYIGRNLIESRSRSLFGSKHNPNIPYIMVTFDAGFVDNLPLVKNLLSAGMNVARINCAHDHEAIWKNLVSLVHRASEETGLDCKVYMDMAGPKLRATILGARRLLGNVQLAEGQEIGFAEPDATIDPAKIVIGCSEPNVVRQLKTGARVVFDDGLIEARIKSHDGDMATLEIIRISSKKPQLKAGKGINFPDSDLNLPAITPRDKNLIPFICEHADLIGYSFVRDDEGIASLQELLSLHERRPHIIVKIETPQAVRNLPSLLMQGMHDEVFGVMIARGDLAVEIGFERMSEIQEEIVWISEAAHVPVIWATQVLESLNKSNIATRSEVTDVSHAAMSECVMINKGDFVINVMKTLKDILQRSGTHHVKKRYTFRPMQIAIDYFKHVRQPV